MPEKTRFGKQVYAFTGFAVQKRSLLFLLMLPLTFNTHAQGYLKTAGKKIVNEKGENVLLRGIGLGGWMLQEGYMLHVPGQDQQQHKIRERINQLVGPQRTQEFYNAWLASHTTKDDIAFLKQCGFNSVRLPMHYNLFTLPAGKEPVAGVNTWLETGFRLTDSLLAWCRQYQLYLILDLHAAPGGQGNDLNISDRDAAEPTVWESEQNRQKTIALWKKLAARYANEPWIGAYDILNEPNWGFSDPANDRNGLKEQDNQPLKKLLTDITAAIRETDLKHIIIIEGNGWGNNYKGVLPPWDKNMVLSFHKYWNRNDQASISQMIAARDSFNVPIWLGETGENSNVWFTEAIRLFEQNNIGWSWWPLKKLGSNNPLEIRSNPGYEQIIRYWSGQGPKPDEEAAFTALMKLADDTKMKNNRLHKDVVDALFRQPFSAAAISYGTNLVDNGTVLPATDYDLGRNGVAYFDNDTADYHIGGQPGTGNRGRTYRNDGVDITRDPATPDSYYVSDFEPGEWLQYTVEVKTTGVYSLRLRVSSLNQGAVLLLKSDQVPLGKPFAVPQARNGSSWQTIDVENVLLKAGRQAIRVYASGASLSFSAIQFIKQQ